MSLIKCFKSIRSNCQSIRYYQILVQNNGDDTAKLMFVFTHYNTGTTIHVATGKLSDTQGGLCVGVAVGYGPVSKL